MLTTKNETVHKRTKNPLQEEIRHQEKLSKLLNDPNLQSQVANSKKYEEDLWNFQPQEETKKSKSWF